MAQRHAFILAQALFCLALISCGANKTVNSSSTSRGSDPGVSYGTNYLLAECNRVQLTQMNLKGQIGTYYDSTTGQYRADYLNLNITSIPAEIYTNSTLQFQIFRWLERTAGQKQLNTVPVRFFYVDKLTGIKTPSTGVDQISKSSIEAARTAFGTGWQKVSTTQFFERTMIVLTGMEMQYDAISIAMYDSSLGSQAIAQGDVLIPAFYSNPNVYKTKNPLPDLYNLHPNIALLGSYSSENDYYRITEDICHELSGIGTRIPASQTKSISLLARIWGRVLDSLDILFH